MNTPKERYRSNLNFTVVTFFVLVSLATGFYLGLVAAKGNLIETAKGKDNSSIYQNLWHYRIDVFNLLLLAIGYVFVVLIGLVVLGRYRLNKDKHEEIEGLERLGELYNKGLLTKEEFDKKKGELLDDEDH